MADSTSRRAGMARRWHSATARRDAAIALALLAVVVGLVIAEAADGGAHHAPRGSASHGATDVPPGWHEIRTPLTGILYPKQVLAAATYPIVFHHRPRSCWPNAALHQMPPKGALVQIIEYASTDSTGRPVRVPRLPRRPHRFSYADGTYAPFECAGPSYRFEYRQAGHALQAHIWMHRRTVDPTLKAGALQILNRFKPGR